MSFSTAYLLWRNGFFDNSWHFPNPFWNFAQWLSIWLTNNYPSILGVLSGVQYRWFNFRWWLFAAQRLSIWLTNNYPFILGLLSRVQYRRFKFGWWLFAVHLLSIWLTNNYPFILSVLSRVQYRRSNFVRWLFPGGSHDQILIPAAGYRRFNSGIGIFPGGSWRSLRHFWTKKGTGT